MDIRSFFQKNASSASAPKAKPEAAAPLTNSSHQESLPPGKRIKLDANVSSVAAATATAKVPPVVRPESKLTKQSSPVKKSSTHREIVIDEESEDEDADADSEHNEEMEVESSDAALVASTSKKTKTARKKTETKKKVVEPPIKPNKSIPFYSTDQATPGILNGLNFVLTGVLSSIGREDAEDYIKTLGGKVTGNISGKTNYLVCGTILEDGRPVHEGSKYKKAQELGQDKLAILQGGEGELYALVEMLDHTRKGITTSSSSHGGDHATSTTTVFETSNSTTTTNQTISSSNGQEVSVLPTTTQGPTTQGNNPYAKNKVPLANPYAKKATTNASAPAVAASTNPYAKKTTTSTTTTVNPYASKQQGTMTNSVVPTSNTKSAGEDPHSLWTDKYAPTKSDHILGNKDCITKLAAWLNRWEDTFIHSSKGGKKISAGNPLGPFKAALLSGPPGIGKTTTANLVAKETGRQVLEWNASDTRSKKSLAENLGDVTGSQVLSFQHHDKSQSSKTKSDSTTIKRCIIMDEVDGMGAGDRSGMAELIKMIKNSKVPIICICNDRQSPKIKSLAAYCLDLKFRRPVKSVIAKKAVEIGQMEGLYVEQNAAEAIAESCGNDIRQVINCLQMWASKKGTESMTFKAVRERENLICKDEILRVSIFDATKMIVEGRRGIANTIGPNKAKAEVDSLFQRNDAFFSEYSLMGLNVHQNYLKVMIAPFQETKRRGDVNAELQCLDRMAESTLSMSDYAVVDHAVMSGDQQWGLLPLCAIMAIKTGYHAGGEQGGILPGYPEFAGWLGKNSTKGKMKRLLLELRHHMNFNVSGDISELRLLYIPSFRERFIKLLLSEEPQISTAIDLMDEYGLDRDDIFENLDEFTLESKPRKMADLDSKVKASFTREYNKGSHKSQALVDEQGVTKTRRRKTVDENGEAEHGEGFDGVIDDTGLGDDDGDDAEEEENPEQILKLFKSSKKGGKGNKTESAVASKRKKK